MTNLRIPGLLATLLATAAALLAGCGDLRAINEERRDEQSFPFDSDGPLVIDNHGSDLRIVTGDQAGAVEVVRSLTGKATQGDNATWSMADGQLTLRAVCSGLVINCHAHHIVGVPEGIAVEVTSDGPVRAVAPTGPLTATVDQWVRVEEPAGPLDLTAGLAVTVNSARTAQVAAVSTGLNVELSFAAPPTTVTAEARHGRVTVTVPAGEETYRIEASTRDGEASPELASDPGSDRTITVTGDQRVDVRAGAR